MELCLQFKKKVKNIHKVRNKIVTQKIEGKFVMSQYESSNCLLYRFEKLLYGNFLTSGCKPFQSSTPEFVNQFLYLAVLVGFG